MNKLYPDHILLGCKCRGVCSELTGEVEVLTVFVDVPGAEWSEEAITARKKEVRRALQDIQRAADTYGVPLGLRTTYYTSRTAKAHHFGDSGLDEWVAEAVGSAQREEPDYLQAFRVQDSTRKRAGLPGYAAGGRAFMKRPVLLLQNLRSRGHAQMRGDQKPEVAIVYAGEGPGVMRHELLHLFGAADFYVLPELKKLVREHFADSVMISSGDAAPIDPATAYLIGWMPVPDARVKAFFKATSSLTKEKLGKAKEDNTRTGYGSRMVGDCDYTGDMVGGTPHGMGRMIWPDGSVYTGDFVKGERTGRGMLTWKDGSVYTGDFVKGERTGKGSLVWGAQTEWRGSSYSGDFVKNVRTGKGVHAWPNGDTYAGDFLNDVRTGQGIYTWKNGNVYTGGFVSNQLCGWGTMRYTNGTVHEGWWDNGKYLGKEKRP